MPGLRRRPAFITPAWSPLALPGLTHWYSADYLAPIAADATIADWPNRGSAGGNATQATDAKRPIYSHTTAEGNRAVNFVSSDELSGTETAVAWKPATIAAAFRRSGTVGAFQVFAGHGAATATPLYFRLSSTNKLELDSTSSIVMGATTVGANTFGVGVATYSSAGQGTLYLNANQDAQATVDHACTTQQAGIGHRASTDFYSGQIREVVVVNRVIETWERHRLTQYLATSLRSPSKAEL